MFFVNHLTETPIKPNSRNPQITNIASKKLVTSECLVGVEIELENISFESFRSTVWSMVGDGSLRGRYKGELILTSPQRGVKLVRAVRELERAISSRTTLNPEHLSPDRCSTHLHVDVRSFSSEQLGKLGVGYAFAESFIYGIEDDIRASNIFCTPLYSIGGHEFANLIYRQSVPPERHGKYCGFNFSTTSILNKGSVEFRMFRATWDAEELLKRINLCLTLWTVAKSNDYGVTADDFFHTLRSLPLEERLRLLVGETLATEFLAYPDASERDEKGSTTADDIINSSKYMAALASVNYPIGNPEKTSLAETFLNRCASHKSQTSRIVTQRRAR